METDYHWCARVNLKRAERAELVATNRAATIRRLVGEVKQLEVEKGELQDRVVEKVQELVAGFHDTPMGQLRAFVERVRDECDKEITACRADGDSCVWTLRAEAQKLLGGEL